jgi:hypothetical protein
MDAGRLVAESRKLLDVGDRRRTMFDRRRPVRKSSPPSTYKRRF